MKGWRKFRLGDGCITNANSYTPKEKWKFVNYLDTGNITDNKINAIQYIDIENEKLPSRARRKVQENSIIYSTVRPKQRHFGIIKNQPDNFLVSTGFVVIDVNESILDADFLYYLLTQNIVVEKLHIIAEQSVSTYPSIKPSDIENLEISIPDIVVQKRIASILGCLDKKIEQNNMINKNLEQQAQTLFDNFYDSLSGQSCILSEIIDIRDGTHDSPKATEQGYPLVTSKHLLPFGVDTSSANIISKADYDNVNERSKVNTGDILISMIGTVGLISYVIDSPVEFAIKNVGLFKTSQHPSLDLYILYYLKNKSTTQHIEKCLAGSTQKYISLGELRKLPIVVPSPDELATYNLVVRPIVSEIALLVQENRRLSNLRDTLLPKLMSGELDVSGLDI